MKKMKLWMTTLGAMLGMGVAAPALATTITGTTGSAIATGAFDSFALTILRWAQGPLGIGLAITAMVIGAGAGLMRSSPMPALVGLAVAAFFAWGPGIIVSMLQDTSSTGLI